MPLSQLVSNTFFGKNAQVGLSVSVFDKSNLRDLLTMTQVNQNVKELQYNLFDNL